MIASVSAKIRTEMKQNTPGGVEGARAEAQCVVSQVCRVLSVHSLFSISTYVTRAGDK